MMPAERRLELVHHQRKNRTCCRGLLRIMWIFREITLSTLVISFSLLSPGFKWYFECFAPFTQHYSAIRDRLSRMQTTRENKPAVGKEVVKRLLLAEVTITLPSLTRSVQAQFFLHSIPRKDKVARPLMMVRLHCRKCRMSRCLNTYVTTITIWK